MYLETQNPRFFSGHKHHETNFYTCKAKKKKKIPGNEVKDKI